MKVQCKKQQIVKFSNLANPNTSKKQFPHFHNSRHARLSKPGGLIIQAVNKKHNTSAVSTYKNISTCINFLSL